MSPAKSASPPYPAEPALIYYPHPSLRQLAEPVEQFDDELARFCRAMITVMEHAQGVGLAAPQVGVARRIFVSNHTGVGDDVIPDRRIWINPRIESSQGSYTHEEGCLSLPGLYGNVTRPARLELRYQNERGDEQQLHLDSEAGDFLAVIVQHELDHLNGVLFLDHLAAPQLNLLRRRLREMEKDYKKATGHSGAVLRR